MRGEYIMYTDTYLKKLDKFIRDSIKSKKKKYKTNMLLTKDDVFKKLFKENSDILLDIIYSFLKDEIYIDKDNVKIIIRDSEITKDTIKEAKKHLDIVVVLTDKDKEIIVNIELNSRRFIYIKKRNYMYLCKIYGQLLKSGNTYDELNSKYAYQININPFEKRNKCGEEKIIPCTNFNQKYINNFGLFNYYIDYYKKKYYNESDLTEKELWLALFTSTSYLEMYNILGKVTTEEKRNRLMKGVISMGDFFIEEIPYHEYADAAEREEAFNKGIKQEKKQTALNMLNEKIDIDLISKCTGLNKKQISELK